MTHTQAQINLIVPIGTQVVTQIKTQSPKGSVRTIIQIPTDGNHTYRIQLPTGTIVPLKRHEFSIRKQFQSEGLITPLSDRNLKDHVIYRVIIGSRAYGLDDENSDTDRRGIYLPPADLH